MQVNWQFNANQHEPKQGMEGHPPAQKVPFKITNTAIVETKDKTGGMLVVDFTSPLGTIIQRYNINNQSAKAVEIAYQQLSALCRAVNIYNIDGNNECAALRGGQGLMDVDYQRGENPAEGGKGYTELKRVYDMAGNDPSKPAGTQQMQQPVQQAQPVQQQQPMTQQPGGGWGQGQAPATQQAPQQPQQGGWQGGAPQQQPTQQQAPQQTGQAWQPGQGGAAPAGSPPWGSR